MHPELWTVCPAGIGHPADAAEPHVGVGVGAHMEPEQQASPVHEYAKAVPADVANTSAAIVTMATKRFIPLQIRCPGGHTTSGVPFSGWNRP